MSRLAEFRKLEQQLTDQLAELESMKGDSGLQREMDFENKLRACWVSTASVCVTSSTYLILTPVGVPEVKPQRRWSTKLAM